MRKRESVDCGRSGRRATTSERPRITVLIGTYNHGAFIGDAVESVLDQDRFRGGVQIVVVDDGSTDDTRERLQPYESAIDYVYQPNAGQAAAWNLGLSRSHGEIIALLDADDTWHRHKLARVIEEFDKSPEVDVVSHAMTVMSNRGVALAQAPDFALRPDALKERRPLGAYLRGRPPILPPTSGIAVRSAVLARITPIPDQFRGGKRSPGADLYVAYLLPFYAREFAFIHESLGLYRIHGPSLREGGVEHPDAEYFAAQARLYLQLCVYVERAGAEMGWDCGAIRRKFEAIARQSEVQFYARSRKKVRALGLVWSYDDPEFRERPLTRAFRRASLALDVLMPSGPYSALRSWYRKSWLFRLMHRGRHCHVGE